MDRFGARLLLRLDRTLPEPLGSQLEQGSARRSDRAGWGQRESVPSSRALAGELGVSRGLVLDCYQRLQARGYLTTRTGSATRVAAGAYLQAAPRCRRRRRHVWRSASGPGCPICRAFPGATGCGRCVRRSRGAHGYVRLRRPGGSAALQEVLAAYLRRVRGAVADGW